ncbi:MAG TPA: extracellular solute-binding protein, partial [Candidatus Limnocylindrales bacterium]
MRSRKFVVLALVALLGVAACGPAASPTPAPSSAAPSGGTSPSASAESPAASESATPLAVDPAEAVISGVEANATITFWTFYLSPTFDTYIENTIERFKGTYPGVTVNWEDHQATFQEDLNNAFNAGNAPDVINLSVGEGWVSDYAS